MGWATREAGCPRKFLRARVPPQIVAEVTKEILAEPEKSPFYKPFKDMPVSIPEATRQRLRANAVVAIKTGVLPAYQEFAKFFHDEYEPECREAIAATALPDGEAYYAYR